VPGLCYDSDGIGIFSSLSKLYITTQTKEEGMSEKRKQYTPQEKVLILRRHFIDQVPVSDLCDEYGLHPTMFYRWQKVFFENGTLTFQSQQTSIEKQQEKRIASLEAKLSRKNEVLAEVMEEHVLLKKSLGEI